MPATFWDTTQLPPGSATTGQGIDEAAFANQGVPIGTSLTSLGVSSPEAPQQGPGGSTANGNYGNLSDPSTWMGLVGNDAQLTQWVQQQNPGLSPDLVQYYVGKIKGQPGANPTEQAGSAAYWQQKLKSDPTTSGGQAQNATGAQGVSTSNPNGIPGLDPGFAFQAGEALKAIQRSAASKGTLLTGGTLKGIADYIGNDLASSAYQGAFNRNYSLASLGENAAAGQGANNTGYATNATNAITNNANAQGAAGIAQGNILTNAVNNAATGYTLSKLFPTTVPPVNQYGAPPSTGAYG